MGKHYYSMVNLGFCTQAAPKSSVRQNFRKAPSYGPRLHRKRSSAVRQKGIDANTIIRTPTAHRRYPKFRAGIPAANGLLWREPPCRSGLATRMGLGSRPGPPEGSRWKSLGMSRLPLRMARCPLSRLSEGRGGLAEGPAPTRGGRPGDFGAEAPEAAPRGRTRFFMTSSDSHTLGFTFSIMRPLPGSTFVTVAGSHSPCVSL